MTALFANPLYLYLVIAVASAVTSAMVVLAGVAFLLKHQNIRMSFMNSQMAGMEKMLETLKADMKTMANTMDKDRQTTFERTEKTLHHILERMVTLENRILDHSSSKQSGKQVNEAIRLAQLQTPPKQIAEQTGIPYDMAKTIATFHLAQ